MSKTEAWKTWEGRMVDGKYPLRQWLGGSDHSAVFLTGRLGKASEKAAIKLVEADAINAEREVARLRAATKLFHPNLISVFEAGRCQMNGTSLLYTAMEYAEEDLSQILPQRPLTPSEVSDMLHPLLDALSYLHGSGFVHGHIKPSNVLAVGDQLKLSADQVIPAGEPISVGRAMGVYDAPETASGTVSSAADVWSLGVTIVAALTQRATPAAPESQGDPTLPGSIPEPFRGIARECLHLDPKRRCSVAEIRARLQPAARSVPAERETTPARERDTNRLPAFAIPLVLVVVALAAWGLFHSRGKGASAPPPDTKQQSEAQAPPKPTPAAPQTAKPAKRTTAAGGAVLHQIIPDIPKSAKSTIRGTIKVTVRVDVAPSGKVIAAKLTASGPSKYFASKALKAAEQWEFSPPQVEGQSTTSAWLLQFRFRRSSVQASAQRVIR